MDNVRFELKMPLVILLTIACGLAIGNLYWAQPLLVQIANDLHIEVAKSSLLITATQIGYALGILFIVPLGDICPRRKLIGIMMFLVSLSLIACALSPTFIFLAFSLSTMGITTVAGQIIVPMSRDLANPQQQGQVVGIITAGITIGILIARSLSGLVADILGWRAIYGIAAVLNLLLMVALWKLLPKPPPRKKLSYAALIGDVFKSVTQYRPLKWILITNGLAFGFVFNIFWNAVTFLLGSQPFNFNTFQIGLVSLAGLVGAASSVWVGKLQDKGIGVQAIGVFIALSFASILVALFASQSVVLIVVAAAIYSLGIQGVGTLNQLRAMNLDAAKSSRLNTMFVFNNFIFSAIGSSVSGLIWAQAGWTGVCIAMLIITALSALSWFISRTVN